MGQDPAQPSYHGGDLHLCVLADPTELAVLRRRVTRWACGTALSHSTVEDLALATYEAMANVVEHAYRNSYGDLEVLGMVELDKASVTITVLDRGSWRTSPTNPDGVRGRGLVLVHGLADDVDIAVDAGGTTVRMRWDLPSTTNLG